MASIISPKAEVSPKAKIGDNCKIYPFAYIEDDVVIGDNCTRNGDRWIELAAGSLNAIEALS
jgi:UDP-3-O-[3-hydroxymyristoyl] glucosamine N-acyltransferase